MVRRWLAGLVLALFLAPTLFVLYRAVTPPELAPLARLASTVLPIYLGNTLLLSFLSAVLALLLGVGGAFLVAFFTFPGRRLLDVGLVLPLILPPYLVAVVYREMSHLHPWSPDVGSIPGAAAILGLTLYPYVYLLARSAFQREAMGYVEIGQSLGLDRWRIATRALLPLATPAILLGALLVVVEVISDFGTAKVLSIHTLTTAVHRAWFTMFEPTLAAQVALLSALFPLLLVTGYALLTRGRGFSSPANRPRPPRREPLAGAWGWLAAVFCALPVVLGFAWPLAILVDWAAVAFGKVRLDSLYHDLFHTLLVAGGTTVAAVLLGLGLALAGRAASGRSWAVGALWVVSLNYAMPAIVLAVAILVLTGWTYGTPAGPWLADTALLVLLATTLRFTAFAFFSAQSGLEGVSRRVDDAMRCVGRTRLHGVLRVLLPLIRGPLTVGALLVFVIAAKELTLSLVLQPFGFRSLALAIYYSADIDMHGPAAVYALCLALVVVYPVLSLNRWLSAR